MAELSKSQKRMQVLRLRAKARQEEEMGLQHAREAQRLERMADRIESGRAALAKAGEDR